MRIMVDFVFPALANALESGEREVPDCSTVADFIALCEEQLHRRFNDSEKQAMLFLIDSQSVSWDYTLRDGQTLRIIQIFAGG